ncbi:MAG: protein translocase subunit SecD [Acidobacteriota bacterium]
MRSDTMWKVGLIVAVLALSVYSLYPPKDRIKLGLDLKGGVHLVIQVQTDDALKVQADQEISRLDDRLRGEAVTVKSIQPGAPGQIVIDGVDPKDESTITQVLKDDFYNWKYSSRPGSILVEMKPELVSQLREDAIDQALETIRKRVDQFGVAEPSVQRQGLTSDLILVQLPGVDEPQRVKDLIRVTAVLELKLVEVGPASSREQLLAASNGVPPPGTEVVRGQSKNEEGVTTPEFYLVRKVAAVTGRDLRNAKRSADQYNLPAVSFTLTPEGGDKFAKVTGENVGRQLAIVLDGQVVSAPRIQSRIEDEGIIEGSNFTVESAEDLALVLRSGSLPAGLRFLEERSVGPSLGWDSIRKGLRACLIALGGVIVFMLVYYKKSGVNAAIALAFNIVILLGCMAYFRAILTLPGIAGVILGIGMAVDANVLIFERIREELRLGKTVRSAVAGGFGKAFWTIFDSNLTTIIAAVFLFQFGSGPIKGYAVTLIIGILASMFTAIFVSRVMFDTTLSTTAKIDKLSI